ncbi:MAG: hypothetical protein AB7S68_33710 [Polyangiaceae bacterium]
MNKAINLHGTAASCKGYLPPQQGKGVSRREGLVDSQDCTATCGKKF